MKLSCAAQCFSLPCHKGKPLMANLKPGKSVICASGNFFLPRGYPKRARVPGSPRRLLPAVQMREGVVVSKRPTIFYWCKNSALKDPECHAEKIRFCINFAAFQPQPKT